MRRLPHDEGRRSRGKVGPNLDAAFQQVKAEGFKESTIKNVVLDQIRFPTTDSGMPGEPRDGDRTPTTSRPTWPGAPVATRKGSKGRDGVPEHRRGAGRQGAVRLARLPRLPLARRLGVERADLQGALRAQGELTNGQKVKADEQYLLDSIIDPDLEIVKGYQPGVMTSVIQKGQVPKDQAQQLVDFIRLFVEVRHRLRRCHDDFQ